MNYYDDFFKTLFLSLMVFMVLSIALVGCSYHIYINECDCKEHTLGEFIYDNQEENFYPFNYYYQDNFIPNDKMPNIIQWDNIIQYDNNLRLDTID